MEDQKKKKLDKLNKGMDDARKELADAKAVSNDSMKQSYEDIELWKQKELAKGKDPAKVEKKYQKGLKTLERISERMDRYFERMDTRVDDWEFKGRLSLEKASHKKMIKKVLTSSLNKMEKILEDNPETELRYPIAGYCAINKREKINEIQYPNISREIVAFEEAIRKASKKNEYFKTFLSFVEESDSKERRIRFKKEVAETVNNIIESENISIRFLSEHTKIKYANLYNFLKKEIYSDLSFRRAHKLLWSALNIKSGMSREEVFLKFSNTLKEEWEYKEIELMKKELE